MNKIIIISSAIVGVLILGVVGYFIFGNILKTTSPVGTVTVPTGTSTPISQGTGPIASLSDNQVLAYSVQGGEVMALEISGEVVKIINGNTNALSSSKLDNAMAASFSFDGKKVLVKYGTAQTSFFTVFDRDTLLWTGLGGEGLRAADWSPGTHEIAYLEKTGSGSKIGILNTDKLQDSKKPELGFAKTVIGSINELDSDIIWLSQNEILISSKPARYIPSTILKYKIKEKTFEPIVLGVLGATVHWDKSLENGSGLGLEYSFSGNKDN